MDDMAYFEHEALDHTVQQFRLFQLCRPQATAEVGSSEVIECQLNTYDIKLGDTEDFRLPSYSAISYAWGPALPILRILVNGKHSLIRQNLYECLRALRHCGHYEEPFWVDQLCIDQQNEAERNHQVKMMGNIYSTASRVFAWLGYGNIDAKLVFNILQEGFQRIHQYRHFRRGDPLGKFYLGKPKEDRSHVASLFSQPYWSRLWIVQEIYLARELILMYGPNKWRHESNFDVSEPLSALLSHLFWVDKAHVTNTHGMVLSVMRHYEESLAQRHAKRGQPSLCLEDAFKLAESRGCSDLRDKVFALQMCLPEEEKIVVDYTLTTEQVFLRVLNRYRSLLAEGWGGHLSVSDRRRKANRELRRLEELLELRALEDHELVYLVFREESIDERDTTWCSRLRPEGGTS